MLQHDLRAGLDEIIGGVDRVLAFEVEPQKRAELERIRVSGEELARLLDLLNGGTEARVEDAADQKATLLDIRIFLRTLERRWTCAARDRDLAFEPLISPQVPPALLIDRGLLERIAGNLLRNAFAYSGKGTVRLHLEFELPHSLILRVTDEGPGFAAEVISEAARPGARGPVARRLRPEGQGLGLSICRTLCEAQGGWVSWANRPEGGSEIKARIPVGIPASQESAAAKHTRIEELPDLTGWRTLVADDSESTRALFTHLLGAMGADVLTFSDGAGALRRLLAEPVDLAVLDVEMPELDGLEVMRRLRGSGRVWSRLPIIACSGRSGPGDHREIRMAGADLILTKPLAAVIPILHAICDVTGHCPPPAPRPRPNAPGDRLLARLLGRTGSSLPEFLSEQIVNDLRTIAQSLRVALAQGDRLILRQQSHKLIAVAGAGGDDTLTRQARALDSAARHGTYEDINELGQIALVLLDRLIVRMTEDFLEKNDFNDEYFT